MPLHQAPSIDAHVAPLRRDGRGSPCTPLVLPLHETGAIHAKIINNWFEVSKIAKGRLKWLAVGNNLNELNVLTVTLLNSEYGFMVHLARCVDHSLSLVLCTFFEPFENEFGICKVMLAA